MEKFKIGDTVKIVNLRNLFGYGDFSGEIGFIGVVKDIDTSDCKDDPWYGLTPHCIGGSWKAYNLELVKVGKEKPIDIIMVKPLLINVPVIK